MTTTTERASVTAILADLILLQSRSGLPMPIQMEANSGNEVVTVNLLSLDQVRSWAAALGEAESVRTHTYPDRGPIHYANIHRLGWFLNIAASIEHDQVIDVLPAETLADLEQVAAATS